MKPKKALGQNWLQDSTVVKKIIETAKLSKEDNVFEIGPGKGVLTEKLFKKAKRVVAIEKDEALVHQLKTKNKKLEIIPGDILKINFPELIKKKNFQDYKVVANIPYYITGRIIRLLLETFYQPKLIVFLIQKEVAERICASAGKMSVLAVSVQYYGKPEIVDYVPKESFYPIPKVDSAILKITPFKKRVLFSPEGKLKQDSIRKDFFRLVKIGFASPRKTLANNLVVGLARDKRKIEQILISAKLEKNVRAENLSIKDWTKLQAVLLKQEE